MIFHPPKRRTQTITLGGTQRIWRKGTYLKGKQSCYQVTLRSPSKQSLREKGLSDILARCSDEKKDEYYHDLERPESQEFRSGLKHGPLAFSFSGCFANSTFSKRCYGFASSWASAGVGTATRLLLAGLARGLHGVADAIA